MATVIDEMHSFVAKLSQLHYCGINASLNLNTYNGRMYASMHAELSSLEMECNARRYFSQPQPKKTKPSRLKRQLQRKQVFNGNGNTNVDSTPSTEVMSEIDVNESVQVNDQNSVSSDVNLEDVCGSSSMTREEAFSAQNLNDDGTPWTPPSEEDMLHYMREYGHTVYGHQAENLEVCTSSGTRALENCGLPFST